MALTESTMVKLGSPAHGFSLPDTNGKNVSLSDFDSDALVVIFTCNHCPYAKAVEDRLIILGNDYQNQTDFVLISSNEIENFPDDSPEKMAERHRAKSYPFPYLFDESQEVAKAYGAVCTPDIFLYNKDRKLKYRGRLDDRRSSGWRSSLGNCSSTRWSWILHTGPFITEIIHVLFRTAKCTL